MNKAFELSDSFCRKFNITLTKNLINNSKQCEHQTALANAFLNYPTKLYIQWNCLRACYMVSSVFMSDINKGNQLYCVAEYVKEECDLQKYLAECFAVSIRAIFNHIRWKRKYLSRKAQYA